MISDSLKQKLLETFPDGQKHCELMNEEALSTLKKLVNPNDTFLLVAVGGLGRNEQGFHSDLDILIYADDKTAEKQGGEFIKKLWDLDYKVGYSIRDQRSIEEHAKADPTFFSTIIFHQLISGDTNKYQQFHEQTNSFLEKNRSLIFNRTYSKLKHTSYHQKETKLFLNQPLLKESEGGLRGFQQVQWLLALYPEIKAVITSNPLYQKAKDSYYHLWALRNIASLACDRSIDHLTLSAFEQTLILLGQTKQFQAEEILKKVFYCFSDIYDLRILCKNEMEKLLPFKKKFFQFFKPKKEDSALLVLDKKVFVKESTTLNFLKAFLYAVQAGLEVSEVTINQAKAFFKENPKLSEQDFDFFKEFFWLQSNLYKGFFYLHHSGFLDILLPTYNQVHLRPQLDQYHSFTLGEHTLLTLKALSVFYKRHKSVFTEVLFSLTAEEKITLTLSLLLHDIGKIKPGNHIDNNREMIDKILEDLPLSSSQKEDISFLVIEHLKMSHVCHRYDLNRVKVILSFAQLMRTESRLKMMFLLTACDVIAVNDKNLSSHMETALIKLYFKTHVVLSEGEEVAIQSNEKEEIIRNLKKKLDEKDFFVLDTLADNYLFEIDNEEILEDIPHILSQKQSVFIKKDKDLLKIKVFSQDENGFLSKIVAALSLNHLNILSANIFDLKNEQVVDYFYCKPMDKKGSLSLDEERQLKQDISNIIAKETLNMDALKRNFYNKLFYWMPKEFLSSVETKIDYKLLEDKKVYCYIRTQDFPGLLYFVTRFFFQNDLSIAQSRIRTLGTRVQDAFYLIPKSQNLKEEDLRKIFSSLQDYLKDSKKEILSLHPF